MVAKFIKEPALNCVQVRDKQGGKWVSKKKRYRYPEMMLV
jgi:hypothetical protein